MVSFDTVRKIGLTLPEVEESTAYGVTALKIRGQLFTCPAINKSAEPGSMVLRVSFEDRDELIAAAPDVYYVTDHYAPYPSVLIRLSRIRQDALRDLLQMSWKFVIAKAKPKPRKRVLRTRR